MTSAVIIELSKSNAENGGYWSEFPFEPLLTAKAMYTVLIWAGMSTKGDQFSKYPPADLDWGVGLSLQGPLKKIKLN